MARKKKKLKELTDADIAACEPESIWLETRKCPLPAHCVLWVVIILLITGIVWACLAKIDVVVVAEGKLVTNRPNITMKPLERMVVSQVFVKVGQIVEEGQVLVAFDSSATRAEHASLTEQLHYYTGRKLRLSAEANGAEQFVLPAELQTTPAGAQELALFHSRKEYYEKNVERLKSNVARYEATIASLNVALKKYEDMMDPINTMELAYTNLAEKGIAAKRDMWQMIIQRLGNEIELENQKTRLAEDDKLLASAKAELASFQAEWRRAIDEEMVEAELQLVVIRERLARAEYLLSVDCMKAPCRAMVHEIAPYQEGSAVREAESLVTLIPMGEALKAEVSVLPKDVGMIKAGDIAHVKFEAFPFQRYGTVNANVSLISADTYESSDNANSEEVAMSGGGKQPQYRAHLTLDGGLDGIPAEDWQHAGMKVQAEIKVDERRVISYILNPFLKAMDEAAREP